MEHIVSILRTLFFNIDRVIYEGIGNIYDLLLRISRTTILDAEAFDKFYSKIYALIGIFMLFKISISLINYVLNPDDFVDKEKGFASIIKRVVISLVMLVLVPYGFKEAYALQAMLLEDNTLASLIFSEVDNSTYRIDTAGDKMKFILMYTFFQPNYNGLYQENGNVALADCAITYEYDSDGRVATTNGGLFKLNSNCFGELNDDIYSDSSVYGSLWTDKNLYQTYVQGISRQNFSLMFKHNIAMTEKEGSKGVYLVDYMAPLSTAVGVAVFWVLLMFCIDVAVRSVKLAFYQLIAPIPILSYIDPKTKDGLFTKWLKQCGSTFLSLFMRLLALYVAIYLISEVSSSGITDVITGERITDWWVCIFVIIGTLMFAKQLPKILEDTLGIKGTGDFTLNPLKKMQDGMLGGKFAAGATKKAIGTAKGVGAAALVGGAALATGQGFRLGAMGRAVKGGFNGEKFGKNFASSYGAGRARKKQLDQMKADGVSTWDVRGAKLYNAFHGETKAEKVTTLEKQAKAIQSSYEALSNQFEQCDTAADFSVPDAQGVMHTYRNAKTVKKELDELKKTSIDRGQFQDTVDANGNVVTAEQQFNNALQAQLSAIKQLEDELEGRKKFGTEKIMAGTLSIGGSADKVVKEAAKSMEDTVVASNKLIKELDPEAVTITAGDVVGMYKQSKGTAAQASSGKISKTKDIGGYTGAGKTK